MKFRPLHDRVVVRRIDAEDKSPRRAKSSRSARAAATRPAS
jgi:co-chaperonin GroES (HSP10)